MLKVWLWDLYIKFVYVLLSCLVATDYIIIILWISKILYTVAMIMNCHYNWSLLLWESSSLKKNIQPLIRDSGTITDNFTVINLITLIFMQTYLQLSTVVVCWGLTTNDCCYCFVSLICNSYCSFTVK